MQPEKVEFEELYIRVFRDAKLMIRAMDALELDDIGRTAVRDSLPSCAALAEFFWDVVQAVFERRIYGRILSDTCPLTNIAVAEASDLTGCDPEMCAALATAMTRLLGHDDEAMRSPDMYELSCAFSHEDLDPDKIKLFKELLDTSKTGAAVAYLALCHECAKAWDAVHTLEQFRAAQSSTWYRLIYSLL